jgi:Putative transposase
MTVTTNEFIRRFLMHVLPAGFHRIRYYGPLASSKRAENIARARELLTPPMVPHRGDQSHRWRRQQTNRRTANRKASVPLLRCTHMIFIERFERGCQPKHQLSPVRAPIRIDTS